MHLKHVAYLVLLSIFLSSCALMFKEDPEFDESRVPGSYDGSITCSYEPCAIAGETNYTITKGDANFTLHFEDSLSDHLSDLSFKIELDERSYGEAVTVSGFIKLINTETVKLTPYDQHFFYYWTFYDTQQEGERFEMRIYKPGPDNSQPNPDYIELNGYKGIQ